MDLWQGTRLNPEQRRDFLSRASDLYRGTQSVLGQRAERYRGLAEQYKLNPENVVFMDSPLDFDSILSGDPAKNGDSSGNPKPSKKDAIARGMELEKGGMSDEQIEQTLRAEGYIQ